MKTSPPCAIERASSAEPLSSRAGVAFAAILIMVLLLWVLGMGFYLSLQTRLVTTTSRDQALQAEYLAESAAHHAMWRLINESNFPPSETKYYMHDLAGGRYGYRTRRHTETTFAAVSTVGAIGNQVVHQSYVLNITQPDTDILATYGVQQVVKERGYFKSRGWLREHGGVDVGKEPVWIELSANPVLPEIVQAVVDEDKTIDLAVKTGPSWGHTLVFTGDGSADNQYKCVEVVHESTGSDAVIVGRRGFGSDPYYTVWDGAQWVHDPPISVSSSGSGTFRHVVAAADPNSEEILFAIGKSSDLSLIRWTGSSFQNKGTVDSYYDGREYLPMAIAYEQSGDALVLYNDQGELRSRRWNGSSLQSHVLVQTLSDDVNFIRASGDPTGDTIVAAALGNSKKLHVNVWNGSAWSDSYTVDTDMMSDTHANFDVAWEQTGDAALILWGMKNDNRIRYMRWAKGSSLASTPVFQGPYLDNQVEGIRTLPVAGTNEVLILTGCSSMLYGLFYNGINVASSVKEFTEDLHRSDTTCFDIAQRDTDKRVLVDAVSSGTTDNSNLTISHTTSGSDRLMLVGISLIPEGSMGASSITYDGASLSLVGKRLYDDDIKMEIWKLVAPAEGTHNCVVTFSDDAENGAVVGVTTFTGVNQSDALGTFVSDGDQSSTASVNVPSASGELVFDTVAVKDQNTNPNAQQTQLWKLNESGTYGGGSTKPGSSSVTMSWTQSEEKWAIGAVPIKPVE